MTELLTSAQMRALEQAAMDSGAVTGLELMERAGQGVVDAMLAEWPEFAAQPGRAVVLCGPGNNGGDGFVIARLLHGLGWAVDVYLYGDAEKLPPDAKLNYQRWSALGPVSALPTGFSRPRCDLFVDALFGTGLTRAIAEDVFDAVSWLSEARAHVRRVAVDIPSGLCADSGKPLGLTAARTDLTVTFHKAKLGHYLARGPGYCGKVVTADIGLPAQVLPSIPQFQWSVSPGKTADRPEARGDRASGKNSISSYVRLVTPSNAGNSAARKLSKQHRGSHKFSHGHALVLSGGLGRSGAARLAARGALRVGAGLVTVGAPEDAMPECAAQLTAIMLRQVRNRADLAEILQDPWISVLCLGPGLGLADQQEALLAAALGVPAHPPGPASLLAFIYGGWAALRVPAHAPGPLQSPLPGGPGSGPGRGLVLDADALTLLSHRADLFARLHPRCVLTPHEGEFKRLFPDIHAKLVAPAAKGPAYSKVDATREAAKRAGCTILFKGPDTVIANERGACSIHSAAYDRSAAWLATAGSGDVLAGIITGLIARGFQPMHAAETGAWLHVEAAHQFGPGLIAEDLPEQLPQVFRSIEIK